jgi:hypothetical protein
VLALGACTPPDEHRDLPLFAPHAKYREILWLETCRSSVRANAGVLPVHQGRRGAAWTSQDHRVTRRYRITALCILVMAFTTSTLSPSRDTYVHSRPRLQKALSNVSVRFDVCSTSTVSGCYLEERESNTSTLRPPPTSRLWTILCSSATLQQCPWM